MALEFVSKSINVELKETVGDFTINYTYQVKDGVLNGSINASTVHDPSMRFVGDKYTNDGKSYWGNYNEQLEDDFNGVSTQIKTSMKAIYDDPLSFIPV